MSNTLSADIRTSVGKGAARQSRMAGKIPAVMYGPGSEPVSLVIDPDQLERMFRATRNRNTVVDVQVDGKSIPTLVRQVQRHPVNRAILHVDLYKVEKARKVEVMVPLTTTGKPLGALQGGRERVIRRTVRIRSAYDAIPERLTIDVSEMNIGDMRKVSEIPTPDGVEMVFDNDFNVVVIYGKKVKK